MLTNLSPGFRDSPHAVFLKHQRHLLPAYGVKQRHPITSSLVSISQSKLLVLFTQHTWVTISFYMTEEQLRLAGLEISDSAAWWYNRSSLWLGRDNPVLHRSKLTVTSKTSTVENSGGRGHIMKYTLPQLLGTYNATYCHYNKSIITIQFVRVPNIKYEFF